MFLRATEEGQKVETTAANRWHVSAKETIGDKGVEKDDTGKDRQRESEGRTKDTAEFVHTRPGKSARPDVPRLQPTRTRTELAPTYQFIRESYF